MKLSDMKVFEHDSSLQSKVSFSKFDEKLQPDGFPKFQCLTIKLDLINKILIFQGIRSQYISTFCRLFKGFLQLDQANSLFLQSSQRTELGILENWVDLRGFGEV